MSLKIISILGIICFIATAWALSTDRRRFPWRVVLWGLGLQFTFALLILGTPIGTRLFQDAQSVVTTLTDCAVAGASLVFGPLARESVLLEKLGPGQGPILAILITATVIVVSALSSLLYHWGILQRVVGAVAWVMRSTMRTSGSETLATAANIFMGQTEAPLVVRPYIQNMTRSELMALMTGGMATIAGSVLAIYSQLGTQAGAANMAGHLIAASVMSAPAALLMAKVMVPETASDRPSPPDTTGPAPDDAAGTTTNAIDAICKGASEGMMLSVNVLAMLIALVALLALANATIAACLTPLGFKLTLEQVLGWLNVPFAWLMGVPWKDCGAVGQVLGQRIVLNEFVGYLSLTGMKSTLDDRSFLLATYALCGFANIGSIAIQIGGIGGLAPSRRGDLARLGLRAMIAGLLACYLTACIVGLFL